MSVSKRGLCSGLALAALPLFTAAQGVGQPGSALGQLARQKEAMVVRLLEDSALAEQIGGSGNAEAQQHFGDARAHFERARQAFGDGRIDEANAALDAAMLATQQARNRLKAAYAAPDAGLRKRAEALASTVAALRQGFVARLDEAGSAEGAQGVGQLRLIDALIEDGRQQLAAGRISAALEKFHGAERMLTDAHEAAAGGTTLEYRKQFDSADRIYEDELARNQSYVELLPIAIEQLHPPPKLVEGMQHVQTDNRSVQARAAQAAAAGHFDDAVRLLQAGTGAIEKLLQEAGLSIGTQTKD